MTPWALWRRPPAAVAFLLLVDLVAVLLVARRVGDDTTAQLVDLVILAGLAVAYDEFTRRIENQRRGVGRGTHVSMRSVWSVVGLVLLPLDLFAVLAAAVYLHAWLVSGAGTSRMSPFRAVFNTATMVVSAAAAIEVARLGVQLTRPDDPTVVDLTMVAIAALAYFVVNTVLVAGVLAATRGRPRRTDLGTGSENLLELGTLGLGAAAAAAQTPWALALVMPVMYLVQRSALVDELEAAANQDPKTGLLNSAAWHVLAEREVARGDDAGRRLAVLLIDLDHFKEVNDRHGHLVGDTVLQGVAGCLTGTLRDRDVVGRFGGEEFVALLPGLQVGDGALVAERIRATIAAEVQAIENRGERFSVQVTASIGVAALPDHGTDLVGLIAAADAAMYAAKQGGRNRVAVALAPAT